MSGIVPVRVFVHLIRLLYSACYSNTITLFNRVYSIWQRANLQDPARLADTVCRLPRNERDRSFVRTNFGFS